MHSHSPAGGKGCAAVTMWWVELRADQPVVGLGEMVRNTLFRRTAPFDEHS